MRCLEISQTAVLCEEGGAERQEERQMRGGSYSLHFRTVQVIVRRRKMDCCCMPLKPFDSGQFLARTPSSLFYKG